MNKIQYIEEIESKFTEFMDAVNVDKLDSNLTEIEREKANNLLISVSNLTTNK